MHIDCRGPVERHYPMIIYCNIGLKFKCSHQQTHSPPSLMMFYPLTLPVACVLKACENDATQNQVDCTCECRPGFTGELCESESALV